MRERRPVVVDFTDDPGMTEQSHKDACNVNNIIKRMTTTGAVTHLNKMEARYGDVSGVDFQTALEIVQGAEDSFNKLPSGVRKEFKNNPALFLDFVNNPENEDKLVEMGLATRRELEEIVREPKQEEVTDEA